MPPADADNQPNPEQDRDEIRNVRRILRMVQAHLTRSHLAAGAIRETLNMVEVFHHPTNPAAHLNYVSPRQNTAWVSSAHLKAGLAHLRSYERTPRVSYIEGLYPPQIAKALRELNLKLESETPIAVYSREGVNGQIPPLPDVPLMPLHVRVETVTDQTGMEKWWYAYRNAFFDVPTLGIDPQIVSRDLAEFQAGRQLDYLLYQHEHPAGVARITLHGETAQLAVLTVIRESRIPPILRSLQSMALYGALAKGAVLVFAQHETDAERHLGRTLGFIDFGSAVCYSDPNATREDSDAPVEQPLLSD